MRWFPWTPIGAGLTALLVVGCSPTAATSTPTIADSTATEAEITEVPQSIRVTPSIPISTDMGAGITEAPQSITETPSAEQADVQDATLFSSPTRCDGPEITLAASAASIRVGETVEIITKSTEGIFHYFELKATDANQGKLSMQSGHRDVALLADDNAVLDFVEGSASWNGATFMLQGMSVGSVTLQVSQMTEGLSCAGYGLWHSESITIEVRNE